MSGHNEPDKANTANGKHRVSMADKKIPGLSGTGILSFNISNANEMNTDHIQSQFLYSGSSFV
ncbi:hypothetical protein L0436_002949 [Salmonella enterica]|uniref:Uncharacterized protein n=2 Tax=Salmonella enterica TaxID=28901 RepID=A0A5V6N8C2_SALET|nr:hypothetical protein [Salmonella enterica subsp. enterica serovar Irumu]EAN0331089.1 hypothetical protein [Salmonella enterica]EBS4388053.1 hypothetical protein [Salmonella enterica subsp. enterica serovar Panama]EBS4761900.1 hypothetical protein [Salmonella enterica subsp. enterica serovar Poona]ECI2239147.1 hypothetical protein [Salmonella enterica subsp. enterica]EEJ1913960.1 hypothetical protein [Salmonella enterica subsp. enterica serovar Urbana]EHQ1743940.1 hypothetical protein [Salm